MPLLQVHRTVKLHRAQLAFRRSQALYRGFLGGRGSGKSWVGAYDLIRRALPGRTYLVGSPTYTVMQDTTLPTLEAHAKELGVWRDTRKTPRPNIYLANNVTIRFRSAEEPDKMRGPNLSGVWLDEASLMHHDAYRVAIGSLREAGEQGWLSATFTPKGLTHWTYEVFGRATPNTELFHARTKDNPFNPPGFHEQLAQQYFGQFAAQELDGKFVAMEGAEWPAEFFGDHIWFDEFPKDIVLRVLALDPSKGKSDKVGDFSAFIDLALDKQGKLWTDADLDRRPISRDAGDPGRSIIADGLDLYAATRPQAFVIEVNGFQELLAPEFARQADERKIFGIPLYGITNTLPKPTRIRTVGPYLARRELRVRNTPGGRLLVQQLRDFPVGEHDDGPDALELAIRTMRFLLGERPQGEPQVIRV